MVTERLVITVEHKGLVKLQEAYSGCFNDTENNYRMSGGPNRAPSLIILG